MDRGVRKDDFVKEGELAEGCFVGRRRIAAMRCAEHTGDLEKSNVC